LSQEREERKRSGKDEATGEKRIGKDKREREGKEKKGRWGQKSVHACQSYSKT